MGSVTVGRSYIVGSNAAQTLIERWNGTKWSIVPSPDPQGSATATLLHGLAAISRSDIFATGAIVHEVDPGQNVILRWNGSSWQSVKSPGSGTDNDGLQSITAVSAKAAWAVGASSNASGSVQRPLLMHWNGTRWTAVSLPSTLFKAVRSG